MLVVLLAGTASYASNIGIQFDGARCRPTGWTAATEPAEGWSGLFRVYAGAPDEVPPMLGSYEVRDHELTFVPRFPITAGLRYHAIFQTAADRVEAAFDGSPRPANPLARVERIYPSTDVLPSN